MKTISITKQTIGNNSGSHLVNYDYVLTDELGAKKGGSGSFATVSPDNLMPSIRADLQRKLGYGTFDLIPFGEPKRPVLKAAVVR